MKDDAKRIAAYLAKTVPATVSLKVAAVLEGMRDNFGPAIADQVTAEMSIQEVLNNDGNIPTIQYPYYLNFGREVQALIRKGIDGPGLAAMAQSLHDKYEDYGLATATLVAIADEVFNITVT